MSMHAIMLRRMTNQSAPAAADIEHPLARFEPQLAADHLHLVVLRLFERIAPVGEISARILHLGIEKQPVELVAQIVMKLDIVLVLTLQPAARDCIARINVLRSVLSAGVNRNGQRALQQQAQPELLQPGSRSFHAHRLEELDQIATRYIELPGGIQPHQIIERWPADQRTDHSGSANDDPQLRMYILAQRNARAVPQLERRRACRATRPGARRRAAASCHEAETAGSRVNIRTSCAGPESG